MKVAPKSATVRVTEIETYGTAINLRISHKVLSEHCGFHSMKFDRQNFVASVKLNSRTFIGGTTMSIDSSPQARAG